VSDTEDADGPGRGASGGPEAGPEAAPDIYAFWAECRREEPVKVIEGLGQNLYFVTRHEDVETVLRDGDRFSSRVNADTMGPVMGTVMLAMDGDEHRRYRNLVARAFRPSALVRWATSSSGRPSTGSSTSSRTPGVAIWWRR
jgi:cytochrome P450